MTIDIKIPGNSFSSEIAVDDANRIFNSAVRQVIAAKNKREVSDKEPTKTPQPVIITGTNQALRPFIPPHPNKPDAPDHTIVIQREGTKREDDNSHRGFLYIKCKHCGNTTGFNSKYNLDYFNCRSCSRRTNLPDKLHLVEYTCKKCGKTWSYHTNIKDIAFDMQCLECGESNEVIYMPESGSYGGKP